MREVDPLAYPDWNDRLLAAPHASIFHTTNWLQVLHESYGYRPSYFARFQGKRLAVLLPFMEVKSWITGVRGVSLPFSDYCDPIVDETTSSQALLDHIVGVARRRKWQFLQIRGGDAWLRDVLPSTFFYRHTLVLHKNAEELFSGLRSNYRAKIRKARQNDLQVDILRSPEAMAAYYRLHCLTRKRHGLAPQPRLFFENIQEHIIAKHLGFVTLVSYQGRHVAGAVFFCFGNRALYKFGASDMQYQHVYPNYALFWHVIQWLCHHKYHELCFGKSAPSNTGLLQFKDGWGTSRARIHYYQYDLKTASFVQNATQATEDGSRLLKKIPIPLLRFVGSVIYSHLG